METLVEVLCGVDRPESILTWKRNPRVQELLAGISTGAIPLTHEGLSTAGRGKCISHIRGILEHSGLLPARDEHLARFELWLNYKLEGIQSPAVRAPVEQFATWHHLQRLRSQSRAGQSSDGPKRSAKQEITETIKFLLWLEERHSRALADCTQQDVNEYLASGPTTRYLIRTFFVWAKKSRINRSVQIGFRQAKTSPTVTQGQRLDWLRELLTGDSETLSYRVAGILLLLYAQPLTKIAALRVSAIDYEDGETRIALGQAPIPVPEPFGSLLNRHRENRPNLRTAGGTTDSPWLFPSTRAGSHVDPQTIMFSVRHMGIDLRGARNTALQKLVAEVPPPLVAELLGYSYQVAQRHAELAGASWSKYAAVRPGSSKVQRNK